MVAAAWGRASSLDDLARRFPLSRRGMNMKGLVVCARQIGFHARPLRAELSALDRLELPCILHWDMNHFVVLCAVTAKSITIVDPLVGQRIISKSDASGHFTGVALEFSPADDGVQTPELGPKSATLSSLLGRVGGAPAAVTQVLIVALALEFFSIAGPLLTQFVVDDVLAARDVALLDIIVVGFLAVLLLQCIFSYARSWIIAVIGNELVLQWLMRVFDRLLRLPPVWFENRQLGDIASRFAEVYEIQRVVTRTALEAILDGFIAVIALVMMVLYSTTLAGIVAGTVVIYVLVRWLTLRPLREARLEKIVHKSKEGSHFLETLRTIVPLKLFGGEHERRARWHNLLVEVFNRDVKETRWRLTIGTVNQALFGIENLLVFWVGTKAVLDSGPGGTVLTIGMLFAFISYKLQFTTRVTAAIDNLAEFQMLSLRLQRLADIVHADVEGEGDPEVPISDLADLAPRLELSGVSFRYGDGEPWVLHEVNVSVEPGETVAIVGASGSGKTTLAKLLMGLLTPTQGEVRYGGRSIRQLGVGNVRARLGVVMQEDSLISGSILENIAFFDSNPDQALTEESAKNAKLHDDIVRMPMGYHTFIGDLGHGLSGGQKQRLLLARALYKRPSVLVLDEATSHLDLENERAIVDAIEHLRLTVLLIAHRPETIRRAGRVIRVVSGKVVVDSLDGHMASTGPTAVAA